MANTTEDTISTLNNLITTCKDGEEGYREAATGVTSSEMKDLFIRYSQQRGQFAGELQDEVRKLGGEPTNSTSIASSLHRGWINLKSAVTGQDEASVLNTVEEGEDVARDAYLDAQKQPLPQDVLSVIERQYMQVREAYERIRNLRNMANAAS